MVMDILGQYPGLPGVFVAAMFSGALRYVSDGESSQTNNERLLK